MEPVIEAAIGPQQWIGYWGESPGATRSNGWILRDVVRLEQDRSGARTGGRLGASALAGGRSQTVQSWKISSSTHGILASLSASGLLPNFTTDTSSADAWVRLEGTSLHLSRGAFGRVPLYWMQRGESIWFATRLQLLLPLFNYFAVNRSNANSNANSDVNSTLNSGISSGVKPTVNPAALYGYSCFSYVPTPLTPVESIFAVPAGVEQTWRRDQSGRLLSPEMRSLQNWREHPQSLGDEDESTAIAQLQAHLKAAVERQSSDLSDEPVGVLLSGGLDSSVVAALLVQAGLNVRAYTLDLGDRAVPEYPYAERVAQWLDIPLTKVAVTPQAIRSTLIPTVRALDLPFGDGVTVPLYLLCQVASQETRIIFNGEGGDQLFAGWTNKPLIAARLYQSAHPDSRQRLESQQFEQQYLRTFHRLWGYEDQVFQPKLSAVIQQVRPQDWLYPALDADTADSLLHRLRRASLMLKGAQNIHPRATNLAFAHGLQVRSPFCDLPLAEWTFRLSGELCLQGACEKYILKRAVESWLPPEIVWREKRGMGVPLTAWCLREGWRTVGDWLNPGTLQAEGHWQPDVAARVAFGELGGMMRGRRTGEILWLMMIWQLWRSQVLGETPENRSRLHPFLLPHSVWKWGKRWFYDTD